MALLSGHSLSWDIIHARLRFWRNTVIHPFLFATYPVFALFAFNMGQSRLSDALRALIILPLIAGVILFLIERILKDRGRAGMITSLSFLLFFSYGHVIDRLSTTRFGPLLAQLP